MEKKILIMCCGYPYACDLGFGYHVAQELEKMRLPDNVECLEVGLSGCMIPNVIEGKDKMIVVDIMRIEGKPGTPYRLKPEEIRITVNGVTDICKKSIIETVWQISLIGKSPETIFIGVIPKDTKSDVCDLTPEVRNSVPVVIKMIMDEIAGSA